MVKGEVDWCDLLGFSALIIKAPATVTKLSQQPDLVVDNPITNRVFLERYAQRESKPGERLANFVHREDAKTGAVQLLPFLFPWFSNTEGSASRPPESLCYRRPLLTVLRLDLLPGAFSADDIREFLSLDTDQIDQKLWQLYADGRLGSFLERLEEVYPRCKIENHVPIWVGISRFLRREDGIWPHAYSLMRDLPGRFDGLFLELCRATRQFSAGASAIIHILLKDGDVDLTSCIVMGQVFHHGLFGRSKSERTVQFMSASETEELSSHMGDEFRNHHLFSNWLVSLKDPQPLFIILDVGVWDGVCESRLIEVLQEDKVFDAFMLLLFGGSYMVTRDFIGRLIDIEKYVERLQARLASPSLDSAHPTVQAALNKAANRW